MLLSVTGLVLVILPLVNLSVQKYTYRASDLYYDEVHNLVLENPPEALKILYYHDESQTYCLLEGDEKFDNVNVNHHGVLFMINEHPVFYCVIITSSMDYVMLGIGLFILVVNAVLIYFTFGR